MTDTLGERIKARRAALHNHVDAVQAAVKKYVDKQIAASLAEAKTYTDTAIAKLAADNNLKHGD